ACGLDWANAGAAAAAARRGRESCCFISGSLLDGTLEVVRAGAPKESRSGPCFVPVLAYSVFVESPCKGLERVRRAEGFRSDRHGLAPGQACSNLVWEAEQLAGQVDQLL